VATRGEFWWFNLFNIGVGIALGILGAATGSSVFSILSSLFSLAMIVPLLAVGSRRLHDIGRSGWWQLLSFTVIGVFVLLYWFAQPSRSSSYAYGAA